MTLCLGALGAGTLGPSLARLRRGRTVVADARAYEQHPRHASARVLVLGDSSGFGVGASRPERSLAGLIGAHWPGVDITNRSVSGLRAQGLRRMIETEEPEGYDLVIVHIGGNDVIRLGDLDQAGIDLDASLRTIASRNSRVALFTTGDLGTARLLPVVVRPLMTRRSRRLRDAASTLAQELGNVTYVDLFTLAPDLNPVAGHAVDGLHPNDAGYQRWFDVLEPLLDGVLGDG